MRNVQVNATTRSVRRASGPLAKRLNRAVPDRADLHPGEPAQEVATAAAEFAGVSHRLDPQTV